MADDRAARIARIERIERIKSLEEQNGAAPQQQEEPSMMQNIAHGAVKALPMFGAVGGGLIGSALGPLGAVGGAGLGAGIGKGAENIIEKHVYGNDPYKDKSMGDVAKDYAKEMVLGGAGEGAGQIVSKGLIGAAKMLPKLSSSAPAIEAAAVRQGVKATPGMTTESPFLKGLENDLSRSPTIGGSLTRREVAPVYNVVDDVTKSALGDASSLSQYEAGTGMKKGLISDIGQKYQPIQMAYDDVSGVTKDIALNPGGQARVSKNIRNIEGTNLFPEYRAEANLYADAVENAKSAKDLQLIKSRAKETLRNPGATSAERQIAKESIDKVDRFESNSIMREAIASARTPKEGTNIGKDIVGNLKGANKAYRALKEDIGTLARGSKVTSGKYGVANVVKEIDQVPAEKIPDMLFKTNDSEFLTFLKDKHPETYDLARRQKLSEVMKKSLNPQDGQISPRKFLQSIKDLGPEARQHLFGSKVNSIEDVQTLVQSIPENINPSGTARSTQFKQTMNPWAQGQDVARYGLYKGLGASQKLRPKLENVGSSRLPEAMSQGLLQGTGLLDE